MKSIIVFLIISLFSFSNANAKQYLRYVSPAAAEYYFKLKYYESMFESHFEQLRKFGEVDWTDGGLEQTYGPVGVVGAPCYVTLPKATKAEAAGQLRRLRAEIEYIEGTGEMPPDVDPACK